jgi:hypothetical protein
MPLKFRNNLSNTTNPNIMIFDEKEEDKEMKETFH